MLKEDEAGIAGRNMLQNMSCAPRSQIQHRSKYRRADMRGIIFALPSGQEGLEALLRDPDSGPEAIPSGDPRESLRERIDEHARTLPFPAAAIVTDKAEPADECCHDLLTIATVLAKSSGRVYLRDKAPNLDQVAPGRRIVLIVPEPGEKGRSPAAGRSREEASSALSGLVPCGSIPRAPAPAGA